MAMQPLVSNDQRAAPALGYTSLTSECSEHRAEVDGQLPEWLAGTLLRNGPARFEGALQQARHWFDGQAMLHRFSVQSASVTYSNSFLRTRSLKSLEQTGRFAFSEFATDPCRSIFKRVMTLFDPQVTDNAAVSISRLGSSFLAMTEAPMGVEFDPVTLRTLGYGAPAPGTFATAHPHYDPVSGAQVNLATTLGAINRYRFFEQSSGARPRALCSKRVRRPAYIHSFAMTENYLVLTEFPFVVNPIEIPLRGRPFIENFRWEPERGTTVTVWDRQRLKLLLELEDEPAFAFHHVGAWEQDGVLAFEYCDHGTPAIVQAHYLDSLRAPSTVDLAPPLLRRTSVDLASGRIESSCRSDVGLELPRINETRYLKRHRFVYGIGSRVENRYDTADRLVKVDNESGEAWSWEEPGAYPGEPVFVAAPGGAAEDDGVLLSVVLDAGREASFLLVLDAQTLSERARAWAPHAIPLGFHGLFDPA